MNNKFPILGSNPKEYIPLDIIKLHENQAIINHSQILERLAERGGLSWVEALCVLEDKGYDYNISEIDAKIKVLEIVDLHKNTRKEGVVLKVTGDCGVCGKHKNVHEILRNENDGQRIILICDDCINWMEEVVNECKEEYEKKHCYECANYNIGDGIDDISKCYGCEFYIK